MIEYVDQQHEYFQNPVLVSSGAYRVPTAPGYSTELIEQSIKDYIYPTKSSSCQLYQDVAMLKMHRLKKTRHLATGNKEGDININEKVNEVRDEKEDNIDDETKCEIKDEISGEVTK